MAIANDPTPPAGAIFGLDMLDPARRDRYRQLIGDMIVSYLTTPAG